MYIVASRKMRFQYIIRFVVVSLLFVGVNILTYLDQNVYSFQASILGVSLIALSANKQYWSSNSKYVVFLLYVFFLSIYKILFVKDEGTLTTQLSLLGAPLLIGSFVQFNESPNAQTRSFWIFVFRIFIYAFIFETCLAIYERIMGYNVFGWASDSASTLSLTGAEDYRSTGIYGHPLYNSLMVSTAMAFVLISPLKSKYKFPLWILGFVAVLCFNTRGSIVGNAVLMITYIIYNILLNKTMSASTKRNITFAGVVIFVASFYLFAVIGLGGRLASMGLFDDSSAQVRVDIWSVFDNFDFSYFLTGLSNEQIESMMFLLGLQATENFWLDWFFRLGIIFFFPFVFLLFRFLISELRNYSLFEKLFVSGSFLLLASTNNSLSTQFLALFYFFLLIRLFNPKNFRFFVHEKYLDKVLLIKR